MYSMISALEVALERNITGVTLGNIGVGVLLSQISTRGHSLSYLAAYFNDC